MKRHFLPLGALLAAIIALAVPAGAQDLLAQASPAPSPSPTATPSPKPFQMSGYLDAGYVSAAAAAPNGATSGRVFDNLSGSPQLQDVNLTAGYTGTFGGKVELNTGEDANVIHSYPQATLIGTIPYNPQIDLTQAYLSYTDGKATLIGGKFETLAGAEVIESPSDLDFSRSILFGYAVPFTHTGLRLTWAATPQFSFIVGANRGWDTTTTQNAIRNGSGGVAADNNAITVEAGLAWNPSSAFSLTAQGYDGTVDAWVFNGCANTKCVRSLGDLVATWHYNSNISVIANLDDGAQSNTLSPSFLSGVGTVTWRGAAGYISDAFSSKFTATLRGEIFNDNQGYRTFVGFGTQWKEGTLTLQYAALPNLTLRLEGRLDSATNPIFVTRTGAQKTQSQIGLEAIAHEP